MNLPERISSKILVDGECWLWTASTFHSGYGQVWDGRTMARAHRVVYEATRGPIPRHLECDHLCVVRRCVNPDHIELVTHAENMRRRTERRLARERQQLLSAAGWVVI